MYSDQLKLLLDSNRHIKSRCKGIFSADTIPKRIAVQKFVVFNTAPKGHRGQHWVALFRIDKDTYEYFDSLGAKLDFMRSVLSVNGTVQFNETQLQGQTSDSCGIFVGW